MVPLWLHILAWVSLALGIASAVLIAIDIGRHPQPMTVMDFVWPISGLYGGLLAVWAYRHFGRPSAEAGGQRPYQIAKGTGHCGAGCTLGDICAESLALVFPQLALWFGWKSIFPEKAFAVWVLDFLFAFAFGILFQYFSIAPMRHLRPLPGLAEAAKADALSLTAWQIGMYGFMGLVDLYLFRHVLGIRLDAGSAVFWFLMQFAMLAGFATAYPVNAWLLSRGIKEAM